MTTENKLAVTSADIHRSRPIKFLWSKRLVKDNFNLVIGNEGVGKGTMMAWVIAQLTRGKLSGNSWGDPCNVAVIGNEDDFDDVWTPRIHACSGNLKNVVTISRDDFDQIDIRRDISELTEIVQRHKISLIYFDQFLDNLATETDHYHAKQVRAAMAPLGAVAKTIGVTTVATMHPNKRAENFRQLVQGTSAFNAMARSSLYIAQHPAKDDVRVVVTAKGNYAGLGHGLEFRIREYVDRPNGYKLSVSKAMGWKVSEVDIDALIAAGNNGSRRETNKEVIGRFITGALADGQWHEAAEIMQDLMVDGYSQRTVKWVASELGVERKKVGFQGGVQWRHRNGNGDRRENGNGRENGKK